MTLARIRVWVQSLSVGMICGMMAVAAPLAAADRQLSFHAMSESEIGLFLERFPDEFASEVIEFHIAHPSERDGIVAQEKEALAQLDYSSSEFYTLSVHGQVVGQVWVATGNGPEFSGGYLEKEDVFWVQYLTVLPSFQGQGYGKLLMPFIEKVALAKGYTEVHLAVFAANTRAKSLYEKSGYRSVAAYHRDGEATPTTLFMAKDLVQTSGSHLNEPGMLGSQAGESVSR